MIFGKFVNRFYWKYWYYFIGGIFCLILVDIVQIFIPKIVGEAVSKLDNGVFLNQDYITLIISFAFIGITMFSGRLLWRVCINGVGIKIEAEMRKMMFLHSEKLSVTYYNKQKTGGLMALYTNDLTAIKMTFTDGIIFLVDALVMGSLAFYNMFVIDWILATICLIPLLLLGISGGIIGKIESTRYERRQKSFEKLSDFAQENISGITVIKAFIRETQEKREFARLNKINKDMNISFLRYTMILNTVINILIYSIAIIIFILGGYFVIQGHGMSSDKLFDSGTWTQFFMYFDTMVWPMLALAMLIDTRSKGKASIKRVGALLSEPVEINDEKVDDIKELQGDIVFKDFCFAYPDETNNVLKSINLHIEKGENIGIIGRTGSGKTTFVNMFLRLYNLQPDKLLIDGVDINKWPKSVLRDNIGYVAQDSFLFSDPISENIAFSDKALPIDKIKNAAKFTCVHENIVDFKYGYDTILGERGVTLSGGQKQRISMARAVVKEPNILILDDSVSAVDTKTEKAIISNIKKMRKGKTTLIVAHRVSTIESMDHIIVMAHGEIVGYGTHKELIKNSPEYQKIVSLQKLEKEVNLDVK